MLYKQIVIETLLNLNRDFTLVILRQMVDCFIKKEFVKSVVPNFKQ